MLANQMRNRKSPKAHKTGQIISKVFLTLIRFLLVKDIWFKYGLPFGQCSFYECYKQSSEWPLNAKQIHKIQLGEFHFDFYKATEFPEFGVMLEQEIVRSCNCQ